MLVVNSAHVLHPSVILLGVSWLFWVIGYALRQWSMWSCVPLSLFPPKNGPVVLRPYGREHLGWRSQGSHTVSVVDALWRDTDTYWPCGWSYGPSTYLFPRLPIPDLWIPSGALLQIDSVKYLQNPKDLHCNYPAEAFQKSIGFIILSR